MDRIVLEEIDGGRRRRCVSCGHTDTLVSGTTVEPVTRVTRPTSRQPQDDVPVTSVRLVDPRRDDG